MNQWISVKDKLPPLNELIWVYEKDTQEVKLTAFFNFNKFKPDDSSIITHWMPFPEPPK